MLVVHAPVGGYCCQVRDMTDPVFAEGLVGPGVCIEPRPVAQEAVTPIAGVLTKVLPHGYVVEDAGGSAVLVHLGIDTVRMEGTGFTVLAEEGQEVTAGHPVVRWDPADVERRGHSSVTAVVVLDCDPSLVEVRAVETEVDSGDPLFEVDC